MADEIKYDGDANLGEAKVPSHTPITEEARAAAAKREQEAREREGEVRKLPFGLSARAARKIRDILGGNEENKGRSIS